ncbi:hypothetical protein ACB098_06G066100 [Castanea mollissima]
MQAFIVLYSIFTIFVISTALDTLLATQSISNSETIVSSGENFELGFFNPGNSSSRYIGIWYKKLSTRTVVWVANRDMPLQHTSGALKLSDQGILALSDDANNTIWSSNSSRSATNPIAQLLDTGNLVVRDGNDKDSQSFLWQSFDHPSDTALPGMKFGKNWVTGLNLLLTASKSSDDPSSADCTIYLDINGLPQFLMRKGPAVIYRTGHWNGLYFSGLPNLKPNPFYKNGFVSNPVETYYFYQLVNHSVVTTLVLTPDGKLQRFIWIDRSQSWSVYATIPVDGCETYAMCGAFGSCNISNSPVCGCLRGFVPKSPQDWNAADWSNGCVRKMPLYCRNGEGFLKYSGIKLPDTRQSWYNRTMDLEECNNMCLKNCSCTAYATLDIRGGGSGCILWFGELIDIREFNENGQDIYIRMAASELQNGDLELPSFDFATINYATDNFSINNVLGRGGFGPVYKGILEEGQEIAVKRLSAYSTQGIDEFMNEVFCIAKLQHRNLVKLLGCCIHDEERILIYEYMPNKSLDTFIFDPERSILVDWPKRFLIINGIARGLQYLHYDSRLRIIHRDLKAGNVLLDKEMNPKISDFGMAKIFGGDETEAQTSRVAGTYGYMPPEYVIDGLFSIKSDVFSFGVLVLEILSGKRNRRFYHPDHMLNLLGHAWRLYKEDRPLELIDGSFRESFNPTEMLRSIHVGLLCVQESPEHRPTMCTVVLMLSSDTVLPQPKEPGFLGCGLCPVEVSTGHVGWWIRVHFWTRVRIWTCPVEISTGHKPYPVF